MTVFTQLQDWARRIKRDAVAVYFAARDPRTPWLARILAVAIAAYALSPVDLIPDFIPVLGYLDDVLLVPLGLWLVIHFIPPQVLSASREKAASLLARPRSYVAAAWIVGIWVACIVALALWWQSR